MTKEIQLTQGMVALVDDEDYEYLSQWKWYAKYASNYRSYYAVRNEGKFPFRKTIRMHQVLMPAPTGYVCDHIYHNTLDNRKSQLRIVTVKQNNQNAGIRIDNKTGKKGVYLFKGKIKAHIRKDGKVLHLGTFETIEEASNAYKKAAIEIFGEYYE